MVPSGTPGSFIAAMRQCRSDRQRQHISAAYPRNTLPWQHIDAMRPRGGGRSWQYFAVVRFRAADHGKILPRCVPGRQVVASFRRGAFFGRSPMAERSRNAFASVRQWQDIAAMRFRTIGRGSFFASCVPEGASDGKSAPSWQHIAAVHPKRAGFGEICAPCIRKAPQTGVRGCTARISCHEDALFAARAPQIMHGARILPFLGAPFERFDLSWVGRPPR